MKTKFLWIVICCILVGCTQVTTQPTNGPTSDQTTPPTGQNMVNPASAYCEQKGNTAEIRTAADGSQTGVCIFPNGTECDEWAFYRGECTQPGPSGNLPNPASAFCEQQGYDVEIRTAADGSQSGVCVFPNGSECDEWAYFRGECHAVEIPAATSDAAVNGWLTFTDDVLGYSFQYPASAQLITSDEPKRALEISGPGMGTEYWGIAHPGNLEEYRLPEGVDLMQWLTDHNMLGEEQLSDMQIAGTTAIHFRHARSPQSYAFDTYYLANRGQLYQLTIGHSSESEDWDLDNRFLESFQFFEPQPSTPTAIPTALPLDPAAYQDWQTYTHPVYNFTIRIPDEWVVEEVTGSGPGMDGHLLNIHPIDAYQKESIRMTFRAIGEETLLWPTGVGQGDFISGGSLEIANELAQRMLLICPTGEVTSIWYYQSQDQPTLTRGELEFGFIYSASSTHCESGYSLSGKTQLIGETIISSLSVP